MKNKVILLAALLTGIVLCACTTKSETKKEESSLKSVLQDKFLIGVAINTRQSSGQDTCAVKVIKQHFNSIVAENCMKCQTIHPEENRYDFSQSDEFVKFGEDNDMAVIGHCLIWHSQLAPWFCVDGKGNNVSPEILKQRMKDHITTIVSRYKGRIKGWDVVNEAIEDDGTWRKSPFYDILGEEFILLAFEYAHEADPDVELYYNDYAMSKPEKREAAIKLIKMLQDRGLRIDAVGMQGHMGTDNPDFDEFEKSIIAYSSNNVNVMITEWDMSALPTVSTSANISDTVAYEKMMNPYPESLPDSASQAWNDRAAKFFNLFIDYADVITRVTVWGVSDGDSWRNDFPIRGRKDYPLLFDRDYQPKPFINNLFPVNTYSEN